MSDIIDDIDEFVAEHSDIPVEYANTESSLRELIDSLIAAAVQAEREACAKIEPDQEQSYIFGWGNMSNDEKEMWRAGYAVAVNDFAAAIRARSGQEEQKA